MKKLFLLMIISIFPLANCSNNSNNPVENNPINKNSSVYISHTNDLTVYKGSSGFCEYLENNSDNTTWKLQFHIKNYPAMSDDKMFLEVYLTCFNIEVLEEIANGHANILNQNELISKDNKWSNNKILLATTNDSIKTTITGEKYIGIRIKNDNNYCYGWVELNLHEHDDRMQIITNGYCYNTTLNENIFAGQK